MGRLAAGDFHSAGTKWYRYSRTHLHCPRCSAEVRPITRPIGYALQVLMLVAVAAFVWLANQPAINSPLRIAILFGGQLFVVVLLALSCARWGFTYAIGTSENRNREESAN